MPLCSIRNGNGNPPNEHRTFHTSSPESLSKSRRFFATRTAFWATGDGAWKSPDVSTLLTAFETISTGSKYSFFFSESASSFQLPKNCRTFHHVLARELDTRVRVCAHATTRIEVLQLPSRDVFSIPVSGFISMILHSIKKIMDQLKHSPPSKLFMVRFYAWV